jgi:hypothetical protein
MDDGSAYTTSASIAETIAQSGAVNAIGDVHRALERLSGHVDSLRSLLSPVLRPSSEEDKARLARPAENSDLAETIRAAQDAAERLIDQVHDLHERIDL